MKTTILEYELITAWMIEQVYVWNRKYAHLEKDRNIGDHVNTLVEKQNGSVATDVGTV